MSGLRVRPGRGGAFRNGEEELGIVGGKLMRSGARGRPGWMQMDLKMEERKPGLVGSL